MLSRMSAADAVTVSRARWTQADLPGWGTDRGVRADADPRLCPDHGMTTWLKQAGRVAE